jgi:hypothetical protein
VVLASTTLAAIVLAFVFGVSFVGNAGSVGDSLTSARTVVSGPGAATSSLSPGSRGETIQSSTAGVTLELSLDKAGYAEGGAAAVTVVLENDGAQPVTVDDPGVDPQLFVYDGGMNQVGSWARFQKAQEMSLPAGPVILAHGEKYSWTLQWDLGVNMAPSGGQVGALPPGLYLVEATLQVGVGVPASYGQMASDVVQITIG